MKRFEQGQPLTQEALNRAFEEINNKDTGFGVKPRENVTSMQITPSPEEDKWLFASEYKGDEYTSPYTVKVSPGRIQDVVMTDYQTIQLNPGDYLYQTVGLNSDKYWGYYRNVPTAAEGYLQPWISLGTSLNVQSFRPPSGICWWLQCRTMDGTLIPLNKSNADVVIEQVNWDDSGDIPAGTPRSLAYGYTFYHTPGFPFQVRHFQIYTSYIRSRLKTIQG